MASIVERYHDKHPGSAELFEKSKAHLARGGGHRPVLPFPVYIERGQGALKWDVDGNEIVDYVMGHGALLLGHVNPQITEAVSLRLSQGTHMGAATTTEIRWGELVKQLIPTAEQVRFTSTGTESTLLALRLARAFKGKSKILKFRDHFHGWHDYVSPASGINTLNGIPQETISTVVVAEPEISSVEQCLKQNPDIAAVIVEPTGAHFGQFPLPNPKFIQDLRELTTRYDVLLIMDEVITGFRMSRGGAQERFNVRPDLTTMAKIVAGGLPGGAVAGRAEIFDALSAQDDTRRVGHPGTYNGNPFSATAGIACLEQIANEPINERADAMAERLKRGLRDTLTKMEVPGHVHGIASIVHIALGVECDCGGDICTLPHAQLAEATSPARSNPLYLAMANEGVDLMGSGCMVSAAHREEDIDHTIEAFEKALAALRQEGLV